MIVKNEENNIKNCLNSIKDFSDEIIIVDTGSRDKTKDIARKFNSKIFDYQWENDFGKARNFSISKSTKDWIVIIDADEIIDKNDVPKIKEIVNDWSVEGYSFFTKNYTNDTKIAGFQSNSDDNQFLGWFPSIKVRLFQNKQHVKFQGIIHELVEESIQGLKKTTDIFVHHFGEEDKDIEKKKHYLELGKRKAKESDTSKAFLELAIQYKTIGKLDESLETLNKVIEKDSNNVIAYYEKGTIYNQKKEFEKAIESFIKSINLNTKNPDANFGLGMCYFHKQEFDKAIESFEEALLLDPNNIIIYNNLGAIYERTDRLDKAIEILNQGLQITKNHPSTFLNLGIALEKRGRIREAIDAYEQAIDLTHPKKELIKRKINELSGN